MRRAIALSLEAMRTDGGGPFGAVVARDGEIVGEGRNGVTSKNDPTAHAEIEAIRAACHKLGSFSLAGCDIYTSCEPCPMCLSAVHWARIDRIFFANTRDDAASIGFDDARLYDELCRRSGDRSIPMTRLLEEEGAAAFHEWRDKPDKVMY